jgi:hypothetical protein
MPSFLSTQAKKVRWSLLSTPRATAGADSSTPSAHRGRAPQRHRTPDRAATDSIKRFATRQRRQEGACPRSTTAMSQAGCQSCLVNVTQMAPIVLQRESKREVHRRAVQLPVRAKPVLRRHHAAPAPGASVTVGGPARAKY